MNNETRIAVERKITRALIRHLKARSWHLVAAYDGDVTSYPTTEAQAMALVFNLDEVSIRFVKAEHVPTFRAARGISQGGAVKDSEDNDWGPDDIPMHGVLLVLGNGEDIVSDWNYTDGDPDGFNAAMDSFDPYTVAGTE